MDMDLLCTCNNEKVVCGSIAVDAVNIVAVGKAIAVSYTCREIEMLGISGKLFVVKKRVENGKEVKVLEVYI
jgi:hypothetical protein